MLFDATMRRFFCFRTMACTFVACFCLSALLCSGCSKDDDYEIYTVLYGSVTDYETGLPLGNASVVLSPSDRTVLTKTDGTFEFRNLDAQQYTLTVQKSGYRPNRKTVSAISGERMEVNIPLTLIEQ